jgi:SAM-dependent methyltransferase
VEGTNGSNSDTYVLPTGEVGAARLQMQDELYGASTRTMMLERGLRPGLRVLDLPCGTGTVSGWIAQQVGEQGSVVGADIDRDQLWGEVNWRLVERNSMASPPVQLERLIRRWAIECRNLRLQQAQVHR